MYERLSQTAGPGVAARAAVWTCPVHSSSGSVDALRAEVACRGCKEMFSFFFNQSSSHRLPNSQWECGVHSNTCQSK
ncbi:hypothetical protein EYF80_060713 [Liparis tanakae]|uniref:Uncharacterized protein n=1 Tax=Liparis tanakae TaxID=230148 RepID=A0A4Z2EJZ9_9TELE|nr:hypothetical protein EYF80_060713 [Liparis tanakae]